MKDNEVNLIDDIECNIRIEIHIHEKHQLLFCFRALHSVTFSKFLKSVIL